MWLQNLQNSYQFDFYLFFQRSFIIHLPFPLLQTLLAMHKSSYFFYFVVFFCLLFLSIFTTSRIFRAHFIRYTFKRRSWSQTFELIWWIIINIDTRGFGMLWRRQRDTDKSSGKDTIKNAKNENWEEEEINHVDYHGCICIVRWCNSSLPISCSIYFVWCWINNRNDRRSTREFTTTFFHIFPNIFPSRRRFF